MELNFYNIHCLIDWMGSLKQSPLGSIQIVYNKGQTSSTCFCLFTQPVLQSQNMASSNFHGPSFKFVTEHDIILSRKWKRNKTKQQKQGVAFVENLQWKCWAGRNKMHKSTYDLGPLLLTWFTLIPAWISNYIYHKEWTKITYPFLNTVQPLKFRNG